MPISQTELKTALQALLNTVKFRIRNRYGLASQLDLASMKAGEIAMATDTQEVYACFGNGIFRNLARGITIKGVYADLATLQTAHPVGIEGDIYAAGSAPQHLYIWQVAAWTDMGAWNDTSLYATSAAVALKAPLASPTFTGSVTVPTPTTDMQASTKKYVDDSIAFVPACRAKTTAAQSIPNETVTTLVNFGAEDFDTDAIHDNVTNNTRLTCKTAGIYLITTIVKFASNATGLRQVSLLFNGTTEIGVVRAAGNSFMCINTLYQLSVNDYVVVNAYQSSGGALNTDASGNSFSMVKIG